MDSKMVEPYFSFVDSGQKTIEGRVNIGKWKNIKPGTMLRILEPSSGKTISRTVVNVIYARSFGDLYDMFGKKLLPNASTRKEAEKLYNDIFLKIYTQEQLEEYGVVGLSFTGLVMDFV